jgi:hypothetical protein
MSTSRKRALVIIGGLTAQIDAHLEKMRALPFSLDYNHWRAEVQTWIRQVERLAEHVGRRSRSEVLHHVEQWKQAAGIEDDGGPGTQG